MLSALAFIITDIEDIGIVNVGDANNQNAHFSKGTVYHTGRNMDHGALAHFFLLAVENHLTLALEDIVELSGTLVVVGPGAVNVNGVSPGGDIIIFPAKQPVTVSAGTGFPCRFFLMAQDQAGGRGWVWLFRHRL